MDPNDEVTRELYAMLSATNQAVMGLIPRNDDATSPEQWSNPFNGDSPAAAEARLEALHRVEAAAHTIGRIVAMRELEAGTISQRRAATLLGVAQMTVNRWYREHREQQAARLQADDLTD